MCAAWVIGLYLGQRWGEGGGGGRGGEAMNAYIINKEEGEKNERTERRVFPPCLHSTKAAVMAGWSHGWLPWALFSLLFLACKKDSSTWPKDSST